MADRLATYRSMRDFSRTAEPSGKAQAPKSQRLRFVVQKHAATRLHYDLRLEHEGVFLSWAVTRGPSRDPQDKRLAVEVEPHPLDYGDFEGAIPKGQYGGGTVMLWDRGHWEPEPGKTIEQGLKHGHLSFTFHGKRLKGAYHLVRIRNDKVKSQRNNWLLIKQDDEFAKDGDEDRFLADTDFSVASGRTLDQIAAGKGRATATFIGGLEQSADAIWTSKASRGDKPKARASAPPRGRKATPVFTPFQLTKLVDRPPAGAGWVHEIKFDGYRIQAVVSGGKTTLRSRKGLDWTDRFPEIAADCSALPDGAYDGEIVALDAEARPDFPGLQAALSNSRTGKLVYFLFDAPFADGEDLRGLPLSDRKARLQSIISRPKRSRRLRYVEHFGTPGGAMLEGACRMQLEGIVSKQLDAPYQSGRNDSWTKAKCRGGQEVVIAGWTTTGDAFRSLIAGLYRDGELVHIGRIGTGYRADIVKGLLAKLKPLKTAKAPFKTYTPPRDGAAVHWVKPQLVAEIAFAGFTGDGNLRQASFKGLRDDKPAREVVAETSEARAAVDANDPAPKTKATGRAAPKKTLSGGDMVLGVTISNPDKLLWPAHNKEPGVSKSEHARYLEAVMPWFLPHIAGRPCSIIRTPDGIDGGQKFFQRHAGAGTSSLINLVQVSGDKDPYLQFDRPEAVIAAAQSGATEFHPWNCLPGQPEIPGRFIFDLDPDESIPFERVIDAAKDVKARLEAVGLAAFLKTTGGKGLHVVTPLANGGKSPVGWPDAKAFAKGMMTRMADDRPDLNTVNMSKKVRKGRIFLDYLRNDRLSTAAALLTARARPGATVSYPLTWAQAKKGLDPKAYTVRTVPALMKRNSAWAGYEDAAASLKDAIKRLGKL